MSGAGKKFGTFALPLLVKKDHDPFF